MSIEKNIASHLISHVSRLKSFMFKNYLSLVKFSHTVFALPFALIGFALAVTKDGYSFEWSLLLKILLCMVIARTSAMAFNRYIDRDYDKLNQRTAVREIPSGKITATNALMLTVICCILFVATTWFINPLCFYLSPVALIVILGYSFTKRFTALCHLILGLGLSLAPIGAYLSVTARFDIIPVFFSIVVLTWVSGFDIIYALQDEEFDKSQKLFSIPAAIGKSKALLVSIMLHTITALFIVLIGFEGSFGWIYFSGAIVFISLLTYQHWLVKPDDLSKVNIAFATTNGFASIIFACFVIGELILRQ